MKPRIWRIDALRKTQGKLTSEELLTQINVDFTQIKKVSDPSTALRAGLRGKEFYHRERQSSI